MYIKHVTIKNYRNFGNPPFEIDLKPFTLILGENNIGKTNLVNALSLIFSQEITVFRKRILEINDINFSAISQFKNEICDLSTPPEKICFPEVRIDVFIIDMNEQQQSILGSWANDTKITETQLTYLFTPKQSFQKLEYINKCRERIINSNQPANTRGSLVDFPIQEYRYFLFGGNDPNKDLENYWLQMLKMEILEALRDAPKELIASSDHRLLYRILSRNPENDYNDIKQILSLLDEKVATNPGLEGIKTDVKNLLNRVSLETSANDNKVDFRFAGMETVEILKKLGLIYGVNPIDISRNGLGRNNLLFISLVLSQLSANSLQGDKIHFRLIGIEEPESHLHPQLQDHLAENIEQIRNDFAEEMQIIITSHSTHIAAKLSLENTCVLYSDSNTGVTTAHYVLQGLDGKKEANTISYLKRYLDSTKSRMLFARKVILVEGFAEQFLIPEFFKIYAGEEKTIEKIGCNVINVNGIAFRHFLKIITNGYFIKCLVLTDQDTGTKTENRAEQLKADFNQSKLVSIETTGFSTFEKDLINANKAGNGKKLFLWTLKATKPSSGEKFEQATGNNDIDVESFFEEIKDYKSEFAFRLAEYTKLMPGMLTIPEYICRGFDFILTQQNG
jgi:putative ATP-dependent endonuclease of OLD family